MPELLLRLKRARAGLLVLADMAQYAPDGVASQIQQAAIRMDAAIQIYELALKAKAVESDISRL